MASLCNVGEFFFFFTQLPPQLLKALPRTLKDSVSLQCYSNWSPQMQSFLPVGFHNTQAERVKVWHFLDNFAFMSCACIVQRFKYKGLLYTKGFFCTVKVLKLVGWLLNRVFKASMKEYQKEECGHWAWCWMEMFLCNFVAKITRCEINRGATQTINCLPLTIINLNSPCQHNEKKTWSSGGDLFIKPKHSGLPHDGHFNPVKWAIKASLE